MTHFLAYQPGDPLFLAEAVATAVGVAILFYALWRGPAELRLFVVFSLLVFALCLTWPVVARRDRLQWDLLLPPGDGNRYFFLPMLAFLASLFWMATDRKLSRKVRLAGALLLLLPIGIFQDWSYPPFKDLRFQEYATRFEQAPPGTTAVIPINPRWTMQLTKQ